MKFIRYHGRVVPIRDGNEIDAKKVKAAGLGAAGATAGVLGAAAAGHVSGELQRRAEQAAHASRKAEFRAHSISTKFKVNAHGQGDLFSKVRSSKTREKFMEIAMRHQDKSDALHAASKAIQRGGNHLAGAAIAAGTYKALEGTSLEKDTKTRAAIGAGSGVAASFAIDYARANKLGADLPFRKMLKSGLKQAAINIARFAVKRRV
jgi:hypothetical protein